MIRADPPEVPSLHRSSESLHQIWESDTRIQHGGCGTLEWIVNIIARLSPPHLAKALKRRSNHNIQSSCCGSSSLCVLNASGRFWVTPQQLQERTSASRWLACVWLVLNIISDAGRLLLWVSTCGREKKIKLEVIWAGWD